MSHVCKQLFAKRKKINKFSCLQFVLDLLLCECDINCTGHFSVALPVYVLFMSPCCWCGWWFLMLLSGRTDRSVVNPALLDVVIPSGWIIQYKSFDTSVSVLENWAATTKTLVIILKSFWKIILPEASEPSQERGGKCRELSPSFSEKHGTPLGKVGSTSWEPFSVGTG